MGEPASWTVEVIAPGGVVTVLNDLGAVSFTVSNVGDFFATAPNISADVNLTAGDSTNLLVTDPMLEPGPANLGDLLLITATIGAQTFQVVRARIVDISGDTIDRGGDTPATPWRQSYTYHCISQTADLDQRPPSTSTTYGNEAVEVRVYRLLQALGGPWATAGSYIFNLHGNTVRFVIGLSAGQLATTVLDEITRSAQSVGGTWTWRRDPVRDGQTNAQPVAAVMYQDNVTINPSSPVGLPRIGHAAGDFVPIMPMSFQHNADAVLSSWQIHVISDGSNVGAATPSPLWGVRSGSRDYVCANVPANIQGMYDCWYDQTAVPEESYKFSFPLSGLAADQARDISLLGADRLDPWAVRVHGTADALLFGRLIGWEIAASAGDWVITFTWLNSRPGYAWDLSGNPVNPPRSTPHAAPAPALAEITASPVAR